MYTLSPVFPGVNTAIALSDRKKLSSQRVGREATRLVQEGGDQRREGFTMRRNKPDNMAGFRRDDRDHPQLPGKCEGFCHVLRYDARPLSGSDMGKQQDHGVRFARRPYRAACIFTVLIDDQVILHRSEWRRGGKGWF